MRELADRGRIDAFLTALALEATQDTSVFLVGGASAVLVGWRDGTIAIDLVMRPESDVMLRAIPRLKERLQVNVELGSPHLFVPVPAGWEERIPFITRIGQVTYGHYELSAQALAKIERGHTRVLDSAGHAMVLLGSASRATMADMGTFRTDVSTTLGEGACRG